MKKLINRITAYLLCATALLSCAQELEPGIGNSDEIVIPEGYVLQTFSALSEQTKTSIVSGNTVWNKEDKILVLYTDGTASDPFALTEGEGTTTGKFQGLVPEGKTASYAIYPHDVYSSVSESTVNVTIASEQPGTFAAGNIAVAKVEEENNMSFRNVNSFLVFQLKEGSQVTKVEVSSVDGSPLAGIVAVDCSGETPTAGEVSEASPSVSMTTDGEGIYYMSIVSGVTHAQGLKMTYYAAEEETGVYYLNRNLTIAVNTMYQLGEVETDSNYYVTVEGAGARNGMNWANAFSKADMLKRITLSEEHSDATNQAKLDALDGAVFHMAAGNYDFGATVELSYDEVVNLEFIGGYDAVGNRNVETNVTAFTGNKEHQIFKFGSEMQCRFAGISFIDGYSESNGGVFSLKAGTWAFTDCKFSGNESAANGGVMYFSTGGSATFDNCGFSDNKSTAEEGLGGCIYCGSGTSALAITVNGGTISGNTAYRGGFILSYNADATFNNVTFTGNEVTGGGGAIYTNSATEFTLNDCVFIENKAQFGGAVNASGTLNVNGCRFENNYASGNAGAISMGAKGGLKINPLNDELTLFKGNKAERYSGAVSFETQNGSNKVNGARFIGNSAQWGGAVGVYGPSGKQTRVIIEGCVFGGTGEGEANFAFDGGGTNAGRGGAIFHEDESNIVLLKSTIIGNYSKNNGGAVAVMGWGDLQMFQCELIGNYAKSGGAIYTEGASDKYANLYIDECSFDSNYITATYGTTMNINGIGEFCMNNSSVRGSYNKTKQSGDKASWLAIDVSYEGCVRSSISNCSIIGNTQYGSDASSLTTVSGAGLIALWGDNHYFTNNIIVPESDAVVSILGGGSDKIDLTYNHYNTVSGVTATDNGGNTTGNTAADFGSLAWTHGCWMWNGQIDGSVPTMMTQEAVLARLNTVCPAFVTWCGNDINYDQRYVLRTGSWWPGACQSTVDASSVYLNVTTYNILKSDGDARHSTYMSMDKQEVRQALAQTIAATQSDIIGFGELDQTNLPGGANDLAELCASINDYTWSLDWPNDISKSGWLNPSYSASHKYSTGFAYNNAKLNLLEAGYVWLSEKEDTWYTSAKDAYDKSGSPERTCIWIKMEHKDSGKIFWVFVTHLPTADQGGQENMAMVVNRFAQSKAGNDPSILLGDMNAAPAKNADTYNALTEYWTDGNTDKWGTHSGSSASYYYPWEQMTSASTYIQQRRIDHVMTKGCTASSYKITPVTYEAADGNLWCPSDHLPVTAKVAI